MLANYAIGAEVIERHVESLIDELKEASFVTSDLDLMKHLSLKRQTLQ